MTNLRKAFASCDATWMRGSSPRMTVVGLPRNQLRKQLRIHIAAGQDADHHLATNIAKAVEFAGEQRGEPDVAARLHHQLQFVKRIAHRSCYLRIACRDASADQFT